MFLLTTFQMTPLDSSKRRGILLANLMIVVPDLYYFLMVGPVAKAVSTMKGNPR